MNEKICVMCKKESKDATEFNDYFHMCFDCIRSNKPKEELFDESEG